MSLNTIVEYFVETGMKKNEALKKAQGMIESLRAERDVTEEKAISLIEIVISSKKRESEMPDASEPIEGVCIGVGRDYDSNGWLKKQAIENIETDLDRAIEEGWAIKTTNGVKPADGRLFVDKKGEMANRNHKKEIKEAIKYECFFIMDDKLVKVDSFSKPVIGRTYTLYGAYAPGGFRLKKMVESGKLTNIELWDGINEAAGNVEQAVTLTEVMLQDDFAQVITRGDVVFKGTTKYGNVFLLIQDNEIADPIAVFKASLDAEGLMEEVDVGYDVIIVGSVRNGDRGAMINAGGVFADPESYKYNAAVSDINGMLE